MRKVILFYFLPACLLSGCTTLTNMENSAENELGIVSSSSTATCADLASLNALTVVIAKQVIAANPNNAAVVSAANQVIAGTAIGNAACADFATAIDVVNGVVQGVKAAN